MIMTLQSWQAKWERKYELGKWGKRGKWGKWGRYHFFFLFNFFIPWSLEKV